MKKTLRYWIALWAGKALSIGLKIMGKSGTTLPGAISQRIDPEIIRHLGSGLTEGLVIVTGTNGKTTTANLLASILRNAGKEFAFNQAGANLVTGITGALLQHTTWLGRSKVKLGLLEVDEATVPKLCAQLSPTVAVITNFFRDQLDRYGELDTTIKLVKDAIPDDTVLVLNADDPLVAQFGVRRLNTIYYGVETTPDSHSISFETREGRFCPECGQSLEYSLFHYGQLGIYSCQNCSFKRPEPKVLAKGIKVTDSGLEFRVEHSQISLSLQGYYNLYNSLAAMCAASILNVSDSISIKALSEFIPQAGRMENFILPSGRLTLTLVKNPTGFNQVLRTVLTLAKERPIRLWIGINDLAADGRDVSWLWDVDFEMLVDSKAKISEIICTGFRAEDMALRLKYAGISTELLVIEHSLDKSIDLLERTRKQDEVVFVLPTYTLLFPCRKVLDCRKISDDSYILTEELNSIKRQGDAEA